MTQFYIYNNTDLGNQVVRLGKMGPLDVQAQQEQVGSGGLDFDDPAGTLNIVGLKPFYIKETAGPAAFTLTGTWTKTAGSAVYVGVGTLATTELTVGRMMIVPGGAGTSYRRVSSITNDTHLTLDYAPANTASGQTATVGSLQRLFTGYVGLRSIARGQGDSLRTGAARRWSVTLDDINSFLSFRVFTESDANRPAETDLARIRWLLRNSRMAGTIYDLGDIPGLARPQTGTFPMDAADYRGKRTADLLNDCSQMSGKNAYVYYEESEDKFGLVYDFHTSTRLSSPIRLTNVLSLVDSDEHTVGPTMTFPIEPGWTEHDDPSRVVAGVYVPYGSKSQAAYVTQLSTAVTFGYRDAVAPNASVKTLTKAKALGKRYLADNATEDVLLVGTVKLPRTCATQLTAGLRAQVYVSHLPSVISPTWTWCRVLRQSIAQNEESDQFYALNMDLTPIGPVASSGGSFLIAFVSASNGNPAGTMPTDGSGHAWTLDYWSGDFTTFSTIACGAGPPANQSWGIWHRAIVPGEPATVLTGTASSPGGGGAWVYQVSGVDMSGLTVVNDTQAFLANAGTATVSANAAGTPSVLIGGMAFGKVNYDGGWCNVTPQNLPVVSAAAGTELVNRSAGNDCSGGPCPWNWQGYATGSGVLSIGATADCYGDCGSSYACGWNIAKGGLLIPTPGTFTITQSAFAGAAVAGGTFNVTLPSPP